MTKNTKTILLSLLACLLLITGFELGAGRIRFGSAILNDSTASLITTNKGFLVNGKLSTSNYADFSNGVRFGDTDITIDDDGLDLRYIVENGGQHIFTTKTGTELATIDSTSGVLSYLPGYSDNGRGLLKTKVLQSTCGATTPGTGLTINHGITNYRNIVSWDVYVYDDSAGFLIPPGYTGSTAQNPGLSFVITSSLVSWFMPAAAGNLKNAGDTIRWVLRYTE